MTNVIGSKFRSRNEPMSLKSRSGGLANRFGTFPCLQLCALGSPLRLSAGFGLRFLPSKLQQKSRCQAANRPMRDFFFLPPTENQLLISDLRQTTQGPQKPKGATDHFHPDLNTTFGRQAVELPGRQAEIAFHESDPVFNAKPLPVSLPTLF